MEPFISLGQSTDYYSQGEVNLHEPARMRHLYACGQTGTGKTTFLQGMVITDMIMGQGVGFFDPHGDAALELLEYVPPHRMDDVIFLRPSDQERAFGFNILADIQEHEKDRAAQEIVRSYRFSHENSWGARMDNIFRNTVRALLDADGATLMSIVPFLTREGYRQRLLKSCQDPSTRDFFRTFETLAPREKEARCQPILNKTQAASQTLRHIIGQRSSTIDLTKIMDQRKILIICLEKGLIGEDDANTLGSLLVTGMYMRALRRASQKPQDRVPFYLNLDEFQSITTSSFADILAEARKYKLSLSLGNQFTDQIESRRVKDAIFGNCGNIISFRVGNRDAELLAPTLECQPERLESLWTGKVVAKYINEEMRPYTANINTNPIETFPRTNRGQRARRVSEAYTTLTSIIKERHARYYRRLDAEEAAYWQLKKEQKKRADDTIEKQARGRNRNRGRVKEKRSTKPISGERVTKQSV